MKISVITVCLNAAKDLLHCLDSVACQEASVQFEHWVIDGGSTDGTVEILEQYARKHSHLHWISEPDHGIADAMNKGILRARGEWLLFLQADDYLLHPKVIQELSHYIHGSTPLVCFSTIMDNRKKRLRRPRNWCLKTYFKTTIPHQGCLIHRSLFDRLGMYDPTFKIAMDYEWFLRAFYQRVKIHIVPNVTIALQSCRGISSKRDWASLKFRFLEEKQAHYKHAKGFMRIVVYPIYWSAYLRYRKLVAILCDCRSRTIVP